MLVQTPKRETLLGMQEEVEPTPLQLLTAAPAVVIAAAGAAVATVAVVVWALAAAMQTRMGTF